MFLVKKYLSPFLLPLPFCLLLCLYGLYLLLFTKRQGTGKFFVAVGVLLLAVLSSTYVANVLVLPFETAYPPYSAAESGLYNLAPSHKAVDFVVVLGGGHFPDETLPLTSQISASSLSRLVEGIRIWRKNAGSRLVLSGGGVREKAEAATMAELASELGMRRADIIVEDKSKDTKDQAVMIKSIVGDRPFVLVTSATHMQRAMALFEAQGMHPIPAPTQHAGKKSPSALFFSFIPDTSALEKSDWAVHEYLGILWARLRKQIE